VITPIHFALILFVVFNWGLSFVVIQFGVAFTAMNIGMSAGLASLVIQMNGFFTVILSSLFFAERIKWFQWLGLGVAFIGITLIGTTRDSSATLASVLLMLVAALGWASANLIVRHVSSFNPKPDLFAFVVHGNAYAPLPLLIFSLILEGGARDWQALSNLSLTSGLSVLYLAWIATVLCFGAWAFLIGHYNAVKIAPFSLLVPVFGMVLSALMLGEQFNLIKLAAAFLVVLGLLINVFGSRWRKI
jgi:O-acetylserine/cysteine efflux transporter